MHISDFLALRTGIVEGWKYNHTVVDLGELKVTSGKLEATDPYVNLGEGAVVEIPAGTYPVRVTIADVSEKQDESHLRETYLSLLLGKGEATKVEFLLPEGCEPLPEDDEDSFYGVPVDSGTIGFTDAKVANECFHSYPNDWMSILDGIGEDSWFFLHESPDHFREGSANIPLPLAPDGENVVMTSSGWGDGVYPVIGSFDSEGKLLGVHIDLLVDTRDEAADEEQETGTPPAAVSEEPATNPTPPVEKEAVEEAPTLGFLDHVFGPETD